MRELRSMTKGSLLAHLDRKLEKDQVLDLAEFVEQYGFFYVERFMAEHRAAKTTSTAGYVTLNRPSWTQ